MKRRNLKIETNQPPIEKKSLDELVVAGKNIIMYLQYSGNCYDGKAGYEIFVRYNGYQVCRQLYNQRGKPRVFRDIGRAIDWGKEMGFSGLYLSVNYSNYSA